MELGEWSSGIGKHIVRLKDGESITGVFRGEPARFYQHWKNKRSVICPGQETCNLCNSPDENERKGTGRFRLNFLTQVNGEWTAKVFEGGKRVYEQLKKLNSHAPIETLQVQISRTGSGQSTQWHLNTLPGDGAFVKPELEKVLKKVPLIDLSMNEAEEEEAEEPAEADVS